MKKKTLNHKTQQCWTMNISSSPENRHITLDILALNDPFFLYMG